MVVVLLPALLLCVCCWAEQQVHRNRLSKTEYPFEGQELGSSARVSSVIVFVVGGITYVRCCVMHAPSRTRTHTAGMATCHGPQVNPPHPEPASTQV